MSKMERRFVPVSVGSLAVEARADGKPFIVGYGAVYYDGTKRTEFELWPGVVERIMPGAFDRAIKEDDVRGLFNHDPNGLLGRNTAKTLALSSDATGLRYEIDPPETTIGQDVVESIRRKDLSGSSFSFIVSEETWRKEENGTEVREIKAVNPLFDVGPVTFPAYEATTAGIRSVGSLDDVRASYEAWKKSQVKFTRAAQLNAEARAMEVEMG